VFVSVCGARVVHLGVQVNYHAVHHLRAPRTVIVAIAIRAAIEAVEPVVPTERGLLQSAALVWTGLVVLDGDPLQVDQLRRLLVQALFQLLEGSQSVSQAVNPSVSQPASTTAMKERGR
jgi:hypothetical protein